MGVFSMGQSSSCCGEMSEKSLVREEKSIPSFKTGKLLWNGRKWYQFRVTHVIPLEYKGYRFAI